MWNVFVIVVEVFASIGIIVAFVLLVSLICSVIGDLISGTDEEVELPQWDEDGHFFY